MNMNRNTNDDEETSSSSSSTSMEDEETSSSSSSTSMSMEMSQGQNLTSDNEIEGGEKESKKIKRGESSSSLMEVEGASSQEEEESSVEEASMNNLPPEMLMEIFKCVDTRSLFNCRLLNRNWSTISSGILRNRCVTRFEFSEDGFTWDVTQSPPYTQKRRSLREFVTCIQNSKDCPFSQFTFFITEEMNPLYFLRQKDFTEFTSYFASENQRIKCLELNFEWLGDVVIVHKLAPKLKDLLLNKIPRLEEFILEFGESDGVPQVKLFSTPTTTDQVQLPNLKVLHFKAPMILAFTGIVKDLLNAAVNLKTIIMRIYKPQDFQFLHSMGKLHLLKEAIIEIDKHFFDIKKSDKNCAPLPFPKLESLNLEMNIRSDVQSDSILWGEAANFLGNLFESSKDTLTELTTYTIGFFPGLQLPTFTKLQNLYVHQFESSQLMFPHGIRSRDVFPAVSYLDLNIYVWDSAFAQENSIPLLPSVKMLSIEDSKCEEDAIPILTLMCPNLRKFQIKKVRYYDHDSKPKLNLLNVGRAIWTHMKQLESLEVDVDLDVPENNPTALDSCFTGISIENCQRLCDLKQANKLLNKWGFQSNVVPESELTAEREHESILDMKDLKKLTINPYSGKTLLKRMDLFTKLSWISEEFAFKFMPHLKPKPEEEN